MQQRGITRNNLSKELNAELDSIKSSAPTNVYTKIEVDTLLLNKVDTVIDKDLSTNDYTNNDKSKVDLIQNTGDGSLYFNNAGGYSAPPSSDGKVKLSSTSTDSHYLDQLIDGITLVVENEKIIAKTLDGLNVTIAELNFVKGVTSSIQDQINALSKPMTMYGVYNTHADLLTASATTTPTDGSTAIIIADENNSGKQWTYIYIDSLSSWKPVSESNVVLRDFTTNPIDLTKEVTGVLPLTNIDTTNLTLKTDLEDYLKSDNLIAGSGITLTLDSSTGQITISSSGSSIDTSYTDTDVDDVINSL
jgi:hypothetical protein